MIIRSEDGAYFVDMYAYILQIEQGTGGKLFRAVSTQDSTIGSIVMTETHPDTEFKYYIQAYLTGVVAGLPYLDFSEKLPGEA